MKKANKLTVAFVLLALLLYGCGPSLVNKYNFQNKHAARTEEAAPRLIKALHDEDPEIRRQAMRYISKLDRGARQAMPDLWEIAQEDPSEDNRYLALRVLRIKRNLITNIPQAKEILKEINAKEQDEDIKEIATILSGELKEVNPIKHTLKLAENNSDNSTASTEGQTVDIDIIPSFAFYTGYRVVPIVREYGILPLNFEIKNESDRRVYLDIEHVSFHDTQNKNIDNISTDEIIERLKYGYTMPVIKTILFGPFGLASPFKAGGANARIEKHCNGQNTQSTFIDPGSSAHGYLFYDVPEHPKTVNGWEIVFNITDSSDKSYKIAYIFGEGARIMADRPITQDPPATIKLSTHNKLEKLKEIYKDGLITKQEYQDKKQQVLNEI